MWHMLPSNFTFMITCTFDNSVMSKNASTLHVHVENVQYALALKMELDDLNLIQCSKCKTAV